MTRLIERLKTDTFLGGAYSHSDYRLNIFKICACKDSYETLCSDLKLEGINLNVELVSLAGDFYIIITGIESLRQEQKYPIFRIFERRCAEEKRLDLRDYIYILKLMKAYKSEGRSTLEYWTRDMTPVIQLGYDFKNFLPTLVVYTYNMDDNDTEEPVFWTESSHQDQQSYIIDIHLGCLEESWIDILCCKAEALRL